MKTEKFILKLVGAPNADSEIVRGKNASLGDMLQNLSSQEILIPDCFIIALIAELPSNVIMATEFCKYTDGFSIGSNDLTQWFFGLDREKSVKPSGRSKMRCA